MSKKYCYMVVDCTDYELPLVLTGTLKELAEWLGITYQSAKNALYERSKVHGKFRIEKVFYGDEW